MGETLVAKLQDSAKEFGSIACFGMDPVPEKLPFEERFSIEMINEFYDRIIRAMKQNNVWPGAVKPNEGFYSRHDGSSKIADFMGSTTLKTIIAGAHNYGIPVILDAKRGDIGKSSKNYAIEAFDVFNADVVTVSPYMGTDSVEPFIKERAAYILCRTSNKGAKDLQGLVAMDGEEYRKLCNQVNGKDEKNTIKVLDRMAKSLKPVYLHTAQKIIDWYDLNPGNVGAVVGATAVDELAKIAGRFVASGKKIPLLIPGVGSQGGSAKEVVAALRKVGYDLSIVRINSSSQLNFAWEKEENREDYAGAAVRALKKLNEEIKYKP